MDTKKETLNRYRKTPKGVLTNMYSHQKARNIKNGFGEIGYSLLWLQERYLNDKVLISVMNMSSKPKRLPKQLRALNIEVSSYNEPTSDILKPFEFRILKRR